MSTSGCMEGEGKNLGSVLGEVGVGVYVVARCAVPDAYKRCTFLQRNARIVVLSWSNWMRSMMGLR
ncbi:hypothetical protein [Rubritalea tangerina]|uniref:hypothetical protein n=1 Tax=Rubritalea tangerina TaxID=430798 RepID=UPI0036181A3C